MKIHVLPTGPYFTNCYIVASSALNCVIIDPGVDSVDLVVNKVEKEGLHPQAIWLTHTHWDHIAGAQPLKERYQIPVWVHFEDSMNLISPGSDQVDCPEDILKAILPCQPDAYLTDGLELKVDELVFSVIHTPGHTPGGCCFYCPSEEVLFTGDTLFKRSIGVLDLPTGRAEKMWPSLAKLAQLPPSTKFYPGHSASSTIGFTDWLGRAQELFG